MCESFEFAWAREIGRHTRKQCMECTLGWTHKRWIYRGLCDDGGEAAVTKGISLYVSTHVRTFHALLPRVPSDLSCPCKFKTLTQGLQNASPAQWFRVNPRF